MSVDVFGTLGPSCDDKVVLKNMFDAGMTGIRINLSHVRLIDCSESISKIHFAAKESGITPKILIDMQGPELRIGRFIGQIELAEGDNAILGGREIPLDKAIIDHILPGDEILLDDGKIMGEVIEKRNGIIAITIRRGGTLTQRKSIAISGRSVELPALTVEDKENLQLAAQLGIYGIMQPFVRSADDLVAVHKAMSDYGCGNIKVYAKVENQAGVKNIESYMDHCDAIVIARGDLGNSMPLWELPGIQKEISKICNRYGKPFMVVTQMLASMEHNPVPTRAEVNDIFNSVADGASSVMVTGETAVGKYPVEAIRYLVNTTKEACIYE